MITPNIIFCFVLRSQHRVYDGRGEVARTQDVWGAEGISGRVKFLLLAWAGMPKTSFRKNSDSPLRVTYLRVLIVYTYASATIPTKQRPYAFWGLPALAFALHGWQRLMAGCHWR
jgi:hypothetical protein